MRNRCCDRYWNTVMSHGYRVCTCFVVVAIPLVCPKLPRNSQGEQQSNSRSRTSRRFLWKRHMIWSSTSPQTRLFLFTICVVIPKFTKFSVNSLKQSQKIRLWARCSGVPRSLMRWILLRVQLWSGGIGEIWPTVFFSRSQDVQPGKCLYAFFKYT